MAIPFCIIGKMQYGVVIACKVPEEKAAFYCAPQYGFSVLIRDSEFPVPLEEFHSEPAQRNPRRRESEDDGS
jgi:hypothetical protein